jgi:quercetin dioxygenase-like cupin family protein
MPADADAQVDDDVVAVIETAQLAPVEYEWGAIKWICDQKVTPESLQSFGYAFVLPGKTNPEHSHNSCEEIIYMLGGELSVFARGECTKIRAGQTALIPRGLHHYVTNEGWEPVTYIASFSAVLRDTEFYGETGELHGVEHLR